MRAIVFAVDRGQPITGTHVPKCLLRVRGRTVLERMLTSVLYAGVRTVTCVVGEGAEHVMKSCRGFNPKLHVDYVLAPDVARADGTTLHAARSSLDGAALVLSADCIFPFPLVKHLVDAPSGDMLTLDRRESSVDHTRLVVDHDRVRDVLPAGEPAATVSGVSMGMLKLSAEGARTLREIVESRPAEPACEHLYRRVVGAHRVAPLDTGGAPWRRLQSPADWADCVGHAAMEIVQWELAYARRK